MYKYEDSTEINCPKCFQKLAEKLTGNFCLAMTYNMNTEEANSF